MGRELLTVALKSKKAQKEILEFHRMAKNTMAKKENMLI